MFHQKASVETIKVTEVINYGISHGIVLGPTSSFIYINNLIQKINDSKIKCYADDSLYVKLEICKLIGIELSTI